jgi:uncharacterized membrane protein
MLTYRIAVAVLLAGITFFLTGDTGLTAYVTVVFNVGGSLVYYVFERVWDSIAWGRTDGTLKA